MKRLSSILYVVVGWAIILFAGIVALILSPIILFLGFGTGLIQVALFIVLCYGFSILLSAERPALYIARFTISICGAIGVDAILDKPLRTILAFLGPDEAVKAILFVDAYSAFLIWNSYRYEGKTQACETSSVWKVDDYTILPAVALSVIVTWFGLQLLAHFFPTLHSILLWPLKPYLP